MNDEQLNFITVCQTFISEYENLMPHDERRPQGQYEDALEYAIRRIENIPHVRKTVEFGNHLPLLVSEENMMAFLKLPIGQAQYIMRRFFARYPDYTLVLQFGKYFISLISPNP